MGRGACLGAVGPGNDRPQLPVPGHVELESDGDRGIIVIFTHLLQSASLPTDASALESSISALETSISALEAEIRALDSRSVPWEHALPWFTLAVLVGVAMEWWVIRHDFREEMEAWAIFDFMGIVRFPSRPSIRKLLLEITSVALILFGIFGELGIGLEIGSINSQLRGKSAELRSKNAELRSKSDQLLALVTQQAGDAEDSAYSAKASATSARNELEAVKGDSAELHR